MPELPEVETSRRGIQPHCISQVVTDVIIRQPKLRWPITKELKQRVMGAKIEKVDRRGKYLLLHLSSPKTRASYIMIHLGMSGSLRVIDAAAEPTKHDHFDLILSNEKMIRFNDPRRFGSIFWSPENVEHSLLEKLGPEPLSEGFNADYLAEACRKRKAAIKSVIMDSKVVVGVGNIYAQESLFKAGISPIRAANKVSKQGLGELVVAIQVVLERAIKAGGSSLKDFTHADGKPGYFQHDFKVYGRGGEPCFECDLPLKHKTIGQRTTTYCSTCQK